LLLVHFAGCSKCVTARGPQDIAQYIPATAQAALVVPDLGRLSAKLKVLMELKVVTAVLALQGLPPASEYFSQLMLQLGVDLRSVEGMETAGLDSKGGVALVLIDPEDGYLIVSVRDERRLRTTLQAIARNRLGVDGVYEAKEGGGTVTWFAQGASAPPALGFVIKDAVAYIATGGLVTRLPAVCSRAPKESLAHDASLSAALSRLSNERDFYVRLSPNNGWIREPLLAGATFAVSLSNEALKVQADLPLQPPLPLGEGRGEGSSSLELLPSDAFLVARLGKSTNLFDRLLGTVLGEYLQRAKSQSGLDFQAEVLGNLKSDVWIGLSLAPTATLPRLMAIEARRANPFHIVKLVGVAEVKDAAAARQTLEKLPAVAPAFGALVTPSERKGRKVFLTSYPRGEGLHFALADGKAIAASPTAELDETLDRVDHPPPKGEGPLESGLRTILMQGSPAVVVDVRRLSFALKSLPSSAWGVGGFAVKKSVELWLDAVSEVRAITLTVSNRSEAIDGELALRFSVP